MSDMDETWEGVGAPMPGDDPIAPTIEDDDVDFDTAVFDNMMSVRLRAAFDGAGPSEATEERLFSALKLSLTRIDDVVPEVVASSVPSAPAMPARAVEPQTTGAAAPVAMSPMVAPMIDAVIPNVVEDGMSRVTPVHVDTPAHVDEAAVLGGAMPEAAPLEPSPVAVVPESVRAVPVPEVAAMVAVAAETPTTSDVSHTAQFPVQGQPAVAPSAGTEPVAPDVTAPHPPLVVEEMPVHAAHIAEPPAAMETREEDEDGERPARRVPSLLLTATGKPLKRTTYLAIAASIVAFITVIAVANVRQDPLPMTSSASKTEQVAMDAAPVDTEASEADTVASEAEGSAPTEAAAPEGEAAPEASATLDAPAAPEATAGAEAAASEVAEETADKGTATEGAAADAGEAVEADTVAAQDAADSVSPAVAYPFVSLKKGDVLKIVTSDGTPTVVEATAVGEFVEEAVAHAGVKSGDHVSCEVYHLIAQSDEDNGLYVVHYGVDGAFYLARRQ